MPTQTVRLVVDWTTVKFRIQIQEPAKTTQERYLPDDIVQRIIEWKELKDAEIDREKRLEAYEKAYYKLSREIAKAYQQDTPVLSMADVIARRKVMQARSKTLTRLDKTVSRLEEEFNHSHDVFRAALLKVEPL
jgi:hypothetical protein